MSGSFVNKSTTDREKIRGFSNTRNTVHVLVYTGEDLAHRDMRKFIEVVYRNFEELNTSPELNHTRYEISRVVTSRKSFVLIATINGLIVGYILAEATTVENLRQLMHIYYLYTSPTYRGHGIATYLMNVLQKYSQKLNIPAISLTFDTYNKQLEKFYLANGFVYDSNLRSYQRNDMLVKYI
ncbi:N-acyltransferase [Yasminevirus sp. GU-2018]|uniref:N-acyltransferase n=1 Tax=Yasminevirus sp. GU-2018 TaxID=2420051 RepID=A0A5K0U919_9VIRU|nr:N-acyltransferase [Yasminevirus sp. GU-2018]